MRKMKYQSIPEAFTLRMEGIVMMSFPPIGVRMTVKHFDGLNKPNKQSFNTWAVVVLR